MCQSSEKVPFFKFFSLNTVEILNKFLEVRAIFGFDIIFNKQPETESNDNFLVRPKGFLTIKQGFFPSRK